LELARRVSRRGPVMRRPRLNNHRGRAIDIFDLLEGRRIDVDVARHRLPRRAATLESRTGIRRYLHARSGDLRSVRRDEGSDDDHRNRALVHAAPDWLRDRPRGTQEDEVVRRRLDGRQHLRRRDAPSGDPGALPEAATHEGMPRTVAARAVRIGAAFVVARFLTMVAEGTETADVGETRSGPHHVTSA